MNSEPERASNLIRDYFETQAIIPPIVIGGLGGSGTRLIVRLLREMSVQMGDYVNESEDAKHFVALYDEFITPYLLDQPIEAFETSLLSAIEAHRTNMMPGVWGWKNPRSIYLLPVLDKLIPNFYYIHVIRHGFEMAGSSNKTQLEKYQHCLLSAEQNTLPLELRSIALWDKVNQTAADYGLNHMGERYKLLRYEDVCTDPTRAMQPIATSLGLRLPEIWNEPITKPKERQLAPECIAAMRTLAANALNRFNYSC